MTTLDAEDEGEIGAELFADSLELKLLDLKDEGDDETKWFGGRRRRDRLMIKHLRESFREDSLIQSWK